MENMYHQDLGLHTIPYKASPSTNYGILLCEIIALPTVQSFLLMVRHFSDIPMYHGRGFWYLPCFCGWLEMLILSLKSSDSGMKTSVGNHLFDGLWHWKEVGKVLKVKLKFRVSYKSLTVKWAMASDRSRSGKRSGLQCYRCACVPLHHFWAKPKTSIFATDGIRVTFSVVLDFPL